MAFLYAKMFILTCVYLHLKSIVRNKLWALIILLLSECERKWGRRNILFYNIIICVFSLKTVLINDFEKWIN